RAGLLVLAERFRDQARRGLLGEALEPYLPGGPALAARGEGLRVERRHARGPDAREDLGRGRGVLGRVGEVAGDAALLEARDQAAHGVAVRVAERVRRHPVP